MTKVEEIYKSWVIAASPTKEQEEISKIRLKICQSCDYFRHNNVTNYYYCSDCLCPIGKKIFSPLPGKEACKKEKWDI
jgi:hypothetical protein